MSAQNIGRHSIHFRVPISHKMLLVAVEIVCSLGFAVFVGAALGTVFGWTSKQRLIVGLVTAAVAIVYIDLSQRYQQRTSAQKRRRSIDLTAWLPSVIVGAYWGLAAFLWVYVFVPHRPLIASFVAAGIVSTILTYLVHRLHQRGAGQP